MAPADLIELLTADHRRVTRLLADRAPARQVVQEFEAHLVAEAQVLYPALRRHLPDADPAVDALVETDHRIEEALAQLDHDGAGAEHSAPLAELARLFASHVSDQERLFAELRPAAGDEELSRLGDVLGPVIMEAPTHPHPRLPREGRLEAIADSVASTVDHVRDALRRERREGREGAEG